MTEKHILLNGIAKSIGDTDDKALVVEEPLVPRFDPNHSARFTSLESMTLLEVAKQRPETIHWVEDEIALVSGEGPYKLERASNGAILLKLGELELLVGTKKMKHRVRIVEVR